MSGIHFAFDRWMFLFVGLILVSASLAHTKEKTTNGVWFDAVRYSTPGKYEKIKFLLDEGFDVSTTDSSGNTALYLSADAEDLKAVKLLLERGADPNGISTHADK